jgi:hypothetical protein
MTYLDSAVLNVLERCCRRFQRLTGRTNVWLSVQLTNLSIVVYFIWAAVSFWKTDTLLRVAVGVFCGGLFYVLTQTIFRVPIETYETAAYQRVAKGFRNPRRVRDALMRILFLTLSLVLLSPAVFLYVNLRVHPVLQGYALVVLLTYSLVALTTVVLYLLACDPLPPCVGTLFEWIRGTVAPPIGKRSTVPVKECRDAARAQHRTGPVARPLEAEAFTVSRR